MNNLENDILFEGKAIFNSEINAITLVRDSLGETFKEIFRSIISCEGKVIFTGMGKPGHIATKIAATFSSLGIPSFFLHPAEAQHGDLGMVQKKDLVIIISYSGESSEVTRILPYLKSIGVKTIGITGNKVSTIAKQCDIVEVFPSFEEAGYLKLAPTSSTTVALVYFDALAIVIAKYKGFGKNNFGLLHPAGALGKKLLMTVENLMVIDKENAVVISGSSFKEAIIEMCNKPTGLLNIVNQKGELLGVVSDGDIRRAILHNVNNETTIDSIMTKEPISTQKKVLAVDAMALMISKRIQCLPVINDSKQLIGTIQIKDILKEGISL